MKHKPKNKQAYNKHIKAFINKGYSLKSILTSRRLLATGYWYNKRHSKTIKSLLYNYGWLYNFINHFSITNKQKKYVFI